MLSPTPPPLLKSYSEKTSDCGAKLKLSFENTIHVFLKNNLINARK